jgi:hypothetical protein
MSASQPHDKILFFPQAAINPWIENYYHAEPYLINRWKRILPLLVDLRNVTFLAIGVLIPLPSPPLAQ